MEWLEWLEWREWLEWLEWSVGFWNQRMTDPQIHLHQPEGLGRGWSIGMAEGVLDVQKDDLEQFYNWGISKGSV